MHRRRTLESAGRRPRQVPAGGRAIPKEQTGIVVIGLGSRCRLGPRPTSKTFDRLVIKVVVRGSKWPGDVVGCGP